MSEIIQSTSTRTGSRISIAHKILFVAAIALVSGLVIVSCAALYLAKQGLVSLQTANSINAANIIGDDLKTDMLADDMKKVDAKIKEVIEHKQALALTIFNEAGEERGTGAKDNPSAAKVIKSGQALINEKTENGTHIIETFLPLLNEDRCKSCHGKDTQVLGALKFSSSIEQAYVANKRSSFFLVMWGLAAFIASVICLMVVLKLAVTRKINDFVSSVTDLTRGDGDLTKMIDVKTNDEFGTLADEINSLVAKIRGIIIQIARTSENVSSTAENLRMNSGNIAADAEEVAAQSQGVATAGEEMSATSGDIAQNCHMASEGSQQATAAAISGAKVVDETINVMNSISERVRSSAKAVESLGNRSEQIGEIVGTIEDIADQTNLLALNAAIEAARAGEQGRGFAVVADEVRALAERTTRATREISEMIKSIQQETRNAVIAMEEGVGEVTKGGEKAAESGRALEQILQQINDVNAQIHQVATAAEEQTATTSEISSNIMQVTEAVSRTSRGAQEASAAANELTMLAQNLKNIVSQFKLS